MSRDTCLKAIREDKLVAILRGVEIEDIEGILTSLIKGGIRVLEFTIDHDHLDCVAENCRKISHAKKIFGDQVIIGSGSVINLSECMEVVAAGAQHIVSPNVDTKVIEYTINHGIVSMPGALTPSECVAAYLAGADFVKLFPAGEMGLNYVKAIMAPLCHIPFLAVGGINTDNVKDYLHIGVKGFGIGSHLIDKQAIREKDWAKIETRTKLFFAAML